MPVSIRSKTQSTATPTTHGMTEPVCLFFRNLGCRYPGITERPWWLRHLRDTKLRAALHSVANCMGRSWSWLTYFPRQGRYDSSYWLVRTSLVSFFMTFFLLYHLSAQESPSVLHLKRSRELLHQLPVSVKRAGGDKHISFAEDQKSASARALQASDGDTPSSR
jgi:hypothetical protein